MKYQIYFRGQKVGTVYKSAKRARARAEYLNWEYGAYAYVVQTIYPEAA